MDAFRTLVFVQIQLATSEGIKEQLYNNMHNMHNMRLLGIDFLSATFIARLGMLGTRLV